MNFSVRLLGIDQSILLELAAQTNLSASKIARHLIREGFKSTVGKSAQEIGIAVNKSEAQARLAQIEIESTIIKGVENV